MDQSLQIFHQEFGFPSSRVPAPASSLELWRGRLPDRLLSIWQDEGWCSYADGLVWTVDPQEYEDLVDEWLVDSGLEEIDSFHVFARSAFGDLYVCGEEAGSCATISCALGTVFALAKDLKPKAAGRKDNTISSFFLSSRSDFDLLDESGAAMFDRALQNLGPLSSDEVYGLEPALPLGGRLAVQSLVKLKIEQHLTILRQLGRPNLTLTKTELKDLMRR